MASPHRHSSPTDEREGSTRKRVGKACDRCRLKKSKCNGLSPCSRCHADNAICVFGERRRVQDRVYPKGYVEMLEQQQAQLVAGIRELYHRLQPSSPAVGWPGQPLEPESDGQPLTHSILERLGLLYLRIEGGPIPDGSFEEDPEVLRQKMLAIQGLPDTPTHTFIHSDSDDHSFTTAHSRSNSNTLSFHPFSLVDQPPVPAPKPSPRRPGRPRLNKVGSRPNMNGEKPEGLRKRRCSRTTSKDLGGRRPSDQSDSQKSDQQLHSQTQVQQQLSQGFQLAMEQLPPVAPQTAFSTFPAGPLPMSLSQTATPLLINQHTHTFQPDFSSPVSPDELMGPKSRSGHTFHPLHTTASSIGSTPTTTGSAGGMSMAVSSITPPLSSSSSSKAQQVTHQHGLHHHTPLPNHHHQHHHGNSVSSVSTVESSLSADPMFDLGNASLDDTVSLFDPFVSGDGIMTTDDDPLSSLGQYATSADSIGSLGSSGPGPVSSATASSLSAVSMVKIEPTSFDILVMRQNSIVS